MENQETPQQQENAKKSPLLNIMTIVASVSFLLSIGCLIMLFSSKNSNQPNASAKTENINASGGNLTIAFVETDSLFANYDQVADFTKEIEHTEKKLTGDMESRAKNLKKDYDNYLKVGASMTLSEQKKKEEQLTQAQQNLALLEQRYSEQLIKLKMDRNMELQNIIFDFIKKYNNDHENYAIILSKARTSGTLYSPDVLDITKEILDALNAEYAKNRKK